MPFFKFARLIITLYVSSITLKKLLRLLETRIFLNSSLNPVIYCWRMRQIRRAIIDVVWNLPRKRHSSRYIYNRSSNFVLDVVWNLPRKRHSSRYIYNRSSNFVLDVVWNLPRKRHSSRYIYNRSSNFVLANN